jgi:protein-disulfide isomerase
VRRLLPILIIACVLVLAIGAALVLYRYRKEPAPQPPAPVPTAAARTTEATPSETSAPNIAATAIPTTPSPSVAGPTFLYGSPGAEPMHMRGNPKAPAVLEEFGDFECLPCSLLWPVLTKLEEEYGDRLVVVFREHPLRMHRYAPDAARAAEAAGLQGKFWEMHDALYRNRATWVPADYVRPYLNDYARELQLDVDRFKEDMDGAQVTARLAADWSRGDSLGIDRTPVVFVNGVKVLPPEHNEKGLRAAIDKVLPPKPQ